jgi:hypothetical protein
MIVKTVFFLQPGPILFKKTTTEFLLLFIERKSKDMLKLLNRLASRSEDCQTGLHSIFY